MMEVAREGAKTRRKAKLRRIFFAASRLRVTQQLRACHEPD